MAKETGVTILPPRQGVATSAHVGFEKVVNIDVSSSPGVAKLNPIANKLSASVVTVPINWFEKNPNTIDPSVLPIIANPQIFALGNNGTLYQTNINEETWTAVAGNSTTSANGNGMRVWKDYLFIARDSSLDTFGPLAGMAFTVTVASPGVFTSTGVDHGLEENDVVLLSTTGALPTGLSTNTPYYVISAGLTNDDFQLSTSQGGAAINTSGSQSGTHYLKFWKKATSLGFKAIDSDTLWHPMIVSKNDNKLYGGAGKYVFSLDEATGTFNPGLSATYTWNSRALDLPPGSRIKCLEELGGYLMCGTWQGSSVTDFPIADIYPWDRSSPSFGQPVVIKEFGCHAMLNVGGSLIALVGTKGSIYRCDGANAYLIGRLPITLTPGKFIQWYPGSIGWNKDKVFFGSGGSTTLAGQGLYSLQQTAQGNILSLEHLSSPLNDGTSSISQVTAILPTGNSSFYLAWNSNSAYGIDVTSSSYAYSTNYSGYFDSPLYIVGDTKAKHLFTSFSILFAKKIATGEGIKIQYRVNLTDSFSDLGTFTCDVESGATKIGAVISHFGTPKIPACEMVQFRIALKGSSTTTPEFRQFKIS